MTIKTCHFCGNSDNNNFEIITEGEEEQKVVFVKCLNCGARGPLGDEEVDAIFFWNVGVTE